MKEKNMVLDTLNLRRCLKLKNVTNILSTIKILKYLDLQNYEDIDKISDKVHLELSLITINSKNYFNLLKKKKIQSYISWDLII